MALRRQQDLDYAKSLYVDIQKDIIKERAERASAIKNELREKLGFSHDDFLTEEERKILRIPPSMRTQEEQLRILEIKEKMETCVNRDDGDEDWIIQYRISGIPFVFCFDLRDVIKRGLYHEKLKYIDVPLKIEGVIDTLYPLEGDVLESVLGLGYNLGLDLDSHRSKLYPRSDAVEYIITSIEKGLPYDISDI